ncbi:hypothetical protein FGO68_gene5109 [Halteria grandinella]|uniref:EamA domain-containing protein n=1 Tax=Halteria grandinella TaxID=5974 RepID=A0A8J8NK97_HALGN|nr:hypothetical protein FGO68_gene5109 [Halteria grandinella]
MKSDLKEPLLPLKQSEQQPIQGKQRDSEGFRTPRWYGYFYQLSFVLQICFQEMLGKVLFARTPDMTPSHMLFLRSFASTILFFMLMGSQTKYYLVSSIDKSYYSSILMRVLVGILLLICVYTSIKYLPLVYIALSQNMSPLLTALLSYLFLKKGLNILDTLVLLVSFGGVALLITGAQYSGPQTSVEQSVSLVLPIFTMLMIPVLSAFSSIQLRQMRQLSDYTLGSYLSISMVVIYGPMVFLSSQGFVLIMGIMNTCMNICRTRASQHEEPAKLASINYFQTVFQLIFDVLFFNTAFSNTQIIGISIVLGAVTVRWGVGIKNTFFKPKVAQLK